MCNPHGRRLLVNSRAFAANFVRMFRFLMSIFVIGFAAGAALAGTWPRELVRWIEIPVPKASTVDREVWESAANWSTLEWRAFSAEGQPVAEARARRGAAAEGQPGFMRGLARFGRIDAFIQIKDGWLVAFNRGEQTPGLYWFSHDGGRHEKISSHHIGGFFARADGVHAIEGSTAPGAHHGAVIRIARSASDRRWHTSLLTRLPNTPEAVSVKNDGTALITLSDALVAIDPHGQLRGVLANAPWPKFYPNSSTLSADQRRLYIGMRQYVGEFDLATKRLRFLVPSPNVLHRLSREEERGIRGYIKVQVVRPAAALKLP